MAMHHLVPRDAHGRSNYRLAAIRPSQLGLADDDVAVVRRRRRGAVRRVHPDRQLQPARLAVRHRRHRRRSRGPRAGRRGAAQAPRRQAGLHPGAGHRRAVPLLRAARGCRRLPRDARRPAARADRPLGAGRSLHPQPGAAAVHPRQGVRRGGGVLRPLAAPRAGAEGLGHLVGRPGPPRSHPADRAARVAVRQPGALDRDPGPALRHAARRPGHRAVRRGRRGQRADPGQPGVQHRQAPVVRRDRALDPQLLPRRRRRLRDRHPGRGRRRGGCGRGGRGTSPRDHPRDGSRRSGSRPDRRCRRRPPGRPHLHRGRRDHDPGRAADQGAPRPDRPGRHDRGAVRRRLLAPQPAAGRPRRRARPRGHRRRRRGGLEGTVRDGDQAGPHLLRVRTGADRGRAGDAAQVRRRGRVEARRDRRPGQGHLAARPRLGHPRAGRAGRGSPRRVLDPRRRRSAIDGM